MSVNKLPEFNPNDLGFDVYMNLVEANFVAYSITEDTKKKNLFLVSIGTKNFGILANLAAPKQPTELSYSELVKLLKSHFVTKPSYHRSLLSFQQRRKESSESLKDLYSDLKKLANQCSFGDTFDKRLRDQLFMAVDAQPYFKFLLAEDLNMDSMTSPKLLERIQTLEKAHLGEQIPVSIAKVNNHRGKGFSETKKPSVNSASGNKKCKHCGYPHDPVNCRFKHLTCNVCGVKGHLKAVCFKAKNNNVVPKGNKNIKLVDDFDDDLGDDFGDNMLKEVVDNSNVNVVKPNLYNFALNKNNVPLEIDSGACVSLISEHYCSKLGVSIESSDKKLSAYGGNKINVIGQVELLVEFNKKVVNHKFFVTGSTCSNLCGRDLMCK